MIDTSELGVGTYLHPRVAAALAVPRRQTPSEWAAEHRTLSPKDSAEPGKWSNRRAPYLVEIMDALGDPEVDEVSIMKAAQVGLTEAMRNVLGYWIANDPGPALWVLPDETSAEEAMAEKLLPMVRDTPALAGHLSTRKHDAGRRKILLDHMEIHCGWATSPQSLASRPKRYLVNDEIDKYPEFSGRESDPISLGRKRLTTYGHRAKVANLSTPTLRNRGIHREWEASPIQLHYHVPCPHCGVFAPMAWANVRWPKDITATATSGGAALAMTLTRAEQAAAIIDQGLAWYHCTACGARTEERQRDAMVARGVWADQRYDTIDRDGNRTGTRPATRKRAFHVPALISPWVSWAQMASEFVAALGDDSKMMDWRNSRLGEPFEVRQTALKGDVLEAKARRGHKHGIVPTWATVLLATADTQKDHFWYVIRAWGPGYRSRKIAHGRVATFDELRERCLKTRYLNEDGSAPPMRPRLLAIDSGGGTAIEGSDLNRTHEVYEFALSDPAHIFACKGWGSKHQLEVPVRQSFIGYARPGASDAPRKLSLYHLNVEYFKDVLATRIGNDEKAEDSWELDESAHDEAYRRQMTSEHKVLMRKGRGQIARWVLVSAGADNHLFDCETMQIAASHIANVDQPPPPRRQYGVISPIGAA